MRDTNVLDGLIVGRVDPYIYAFTTNTIPNYLKVGDTYRPVSVRLQEWQSYYPSLRKEFERIAKVDDDVYFRDFSVHSFLEQDKKRVRLQPNDIAAGVNYLREFFKEATTDDISEAFEDILRDYSAKNMKYQFYSVDTRLAQTLTYARREAYNPRPNQVKTIERFKTAVNNGRTNLLMYAVMRFGKSFTSMCCAVEMGAKIVVVVSAKADVMEEWKRTVESHVKFDEYSFLTGESLKKVGIIHDAVTNGKRVVVFLTLQDLQGKLIKQKHREIFGSTIDLLIVDETHFGARAEEYGQAIRSRGYDKDINNKMDAEDSVELSDAMEHIKILDRKITLHLSGTPYRILMGSEFNKDDIIAFYQFSDIVKDQESWIADNNASDEPKDEWDNPYYGFPQMIRFAFNPNESSRQRLKELKLNGVSYAFSALLKTQSIKKAEDGSHMRFIYEREILDLLEVIDGSKDDDELFGFLDYAKIKSGQMCRHIVCVLPYCASCDAMEKLINDNASRFKNLSGYEIVNISGIDKPNRYRSSAEIKTVIKNAEAAGRKTLTLTVNRMLTGSTVEEWDTMMFLKDTASPQEYDQAIFRLQNQYIRKYTDSNGHVIKYNMKPQTLLVDFAPDRMFVMQERKAQIYNVNTDEAGNSKLEQRLNEELRISPIIVHNKDRMEKVQAADILLSVSEYSKNRGVMEETVDIPVDLSLMNYTSIREAIERENELGSKAGLSMKAFEGKETDVDIPQTDDEDSADTGIDINAEPIVGDGAEKDKLDPVKQFRAYYARILFYAFLTNDAVISLEDIIGGIDVCDNSRIAMNVGIKKMVLQSLQSYTNKFILSKLDYKIQNLSLLSHDTSLMPIERARVAVQKFGKISDSEVITPAKICDDMIDMIPDDGLLDAVKSGDKLLDIAGKAGDFAISLCRKYASLGVGVEAVRDLIYTIPTSGLTYELTRKVYGMLGLNIENIAVKFNAYDLLDVVDSQTRKPDYKNIKTLLTQRKPFSSITLQDMITEGDREVKFIAVVGNPPYHESTTDKSAQSVPLYDKYVMIAKTLQPVFISIIIPSRWFARGMNLDGFRDNMKSDKHISEIVLYINGKDCFPDTSTGGICYFLWQKDEQTNCKFTNIIRKSRNSMMRSLDEFQVIVGYNKAVMILRKVLNRNEQCIEDIVSPLMPFGLNTNYRGSETRNDENTLALHASNCLTYVAPSEVSKGIGLIDKYKILVSKTGAEHALEPGKDGMYRIVTSSMRVIGPNEICTHSYFTIGAFDNRIEALNALSYIKTRFVRFLMLMSMSSINLSKFVFHFVPIQDFSKPWKDEELYSKYALICDEINFIESLIKPME